MNVTMLAMAMDICVRPLVFLDMIEDRMEEVGEEATFDELEVVESVLTEHKREAREWEVEHSTLERALRKVRVGLYGDGPTRLYKDFSGHHHHHLKRSRRGTKGASTYSSSSSRTVEEVIEDVRMHLEHLDPVVYHPEYWDDHSPRENNFRTVVRNYITKAYIGGVISDQDVLTMFFTRCPNWGWLFGRELRNGVEDAISHQIATGSPMTSEQQLMLWVVQTTNHGWPKTQKDKDRVEQEVTKAKAYAKAHPEVLDEHLPRIVELLNNWAGGDA